MLDKGDYQALTKELGDRHSGKFPAKAQKAFFKLGTSLVAGCMAHSTNGLGNLVGEQAMKDVVLQCGPCDGEIVKNLGEFAGSLRRRPQGRSHRYRYSGQIDSATGYPIFVFTPPRRRKQAT